jgi:hypothetical protein
MTEEVRTSDRLRGAVSHKDVILTSRYLTACYTLTLYPSLLGRLVGSVLATEPKGRRFNPGRSDLPSDGK